MPGLALSCPLAGGLPLRRLRPRPLPCPQASADLRVRGVRQAALAPGRDDLRAEQDRPRALVPCDLPGDIQQGRDLGDGAAAAAGVPQLRHGWLHKIRRAMVRPGREPLALRVEADETLVGGARSGKPGRGAAGKTVVAGAVESGRGKARGRRLGRLRMQAVPDASAASLAGFLGRPSRRQSPPTAGPAMTGSAAPATPTNRSTSAAPGATPRCACPASISSSASPSAGSWARITAPSAPSTYKRTSTSTSSASTAAPPGTSPTASPA
jgi:hypothetical protein